jgi:hypothetical protein
MSQGITSGSLFVISNSYVDLCLILVSVNKTNLIPIYNAFIHYEVYLALFNTLTITTHYLKKNRQYMYNLEDNG